MLCHPTGRHTARKLGTWCIETSLMTSPLRSLAVLAIHTPSPTRLPRAGHTATPQTLRGCGALRMNDHYASIWWHPRWSLCVAWRGFLAWAVLNFWRMFILFIHWYQKKLLSKGTATTPNLILFSWPSHDARGFSDLSQCSTRREIWRIKIFPGACPFFFKASKQKPQNTVWYFYNLRW